MSTGSEAAKLSRQELYELVWQEPMTELAKRFGLSHMGLAKICLKFEIPRPAVGFWSQRRLGVEGEKPALPRLGTDEFIEIQKFREAFESKKPAHAPPFAEMKIKVAEKLSNPHAIVERILELLEAQCVKTSEVIVNLDGQQTPKISISKKSIPRVLRILDAIFKHWESSGGHVQLKDGAIGTGDDFAHIMITESWRSVEKNNSTNPLKTWEHVATGDLTLEIAGWEEGLRKKWRDGKMQRLENVLGSFFRTLPVWLETFKQQRLDIECKNRQKQRVAERKQNIEKQKKYESERIEELHRFVESWEMSRRIKEYLFSVRDLLATGKSLPSKPEAFAKWLEWAHWHADSLCPLTKALPRNETIQGPENTSINELDLCKQTREILLATKVRDTDELFRIDRSALRQICGNHDYSIREELTLVLAGLGYDMSNHPWHSYHRQ